MNPHDKTDRFYFLPAVSSPKCNHCKHYKGDAKCDAFPEQIPVEVLRKIVDEKDSLFFCDEKRKIRFETQSNKNK